MDPESKKSNNEDEADNGAVDDHRIQNLVETKSTTNVDNDTYDKYIYNYHKKEELLEDDENFEHRGNMWRYNLATNEAYYRFNNLFKDLVMKYQRPVKRKDARRPLESKTLMKLILNELKALNLIHNEPVEGDPDKFIVYLYDSDKAKAEMNKCAAMSKVEKLQKQNKIEKLEDSIALSHDSRKLHDYKIDDLDFESAKLSISLTEQEKSSSLHCQLFIEQKSDKIPTFKTFIQSLNDDQVKIIEMLLRTLFQQEIDLKTITTPQTPTQKEHKKLDTTSAQTSISPTVSGVEKRLLDVELSGLSTSESSLPRLIKSDSSISPSKKSICKKLPASKSSPSPSTPVGSSQAKPKTPKYGHIQSTIPKSTSAIKRPTSATKKPTSATKKPK